MRIYTVLLMAFLITSLVFPETTADFLIVSDPRIYTIYDQYQQPLSSADKTSLGSYAPFQVVEKDVLIGELPNQHPGIGLRDNPPRLSESNPVLTILGHGPHLAEARAGH